MCPCWVKRRLGEFAQTNCAGCCCVKSCFSHLRQEKMRFKHSTKKTGVGTRRNPSENQFLRRNPSDFFFRFFCPEMFFWHNSASKPLFHAMFQQESQYGYSEC